MTKTEMYREALKKVKNWEPYLLKESGLPGPRGNLELVQAVADEGSLEIFERLLAAGASPAGAKTAQEFLAVCGTVGLGRLLAEGNRTMLRRLRTLATDPRWRVREGVAMALQRWGDVDIDGMLTEMERWGGGPPLVQRAAAAAICEPRLLTDPQQARRVLRTLTGITASAARRTDRTGPEWTALRQALGYCWSVAVAAYPAEGKRAMDKWLVSRDKDIRWIMRENLKKQRLARIDPDWVAWARTRLGED